MSSQVFILLAGVIFTAFAVESALGFGATVVAVSLGSLILPIETILPALIPLNLVLSFYLASRYRASIVWWLLLKRILPLMALGLPMGIVAFRTLGTAKLQSLFGLFVVCLSLAELNRARRTASASPSAAPVLTARRTSPMESALLVLAGVVHGAFATGGPLAVYVTGRALGDKAGFRATLSALWLLLNTILVASYAFTGELSISSARTSVALALPLLLGSVVGEWAHRHVPAKAFKLLVFVVLLVAGTVLSLRA